MMTQPRSASPDDSSGIALKAASVTPTSRRRPGSFLNRMPTLCRRTHRKTRFKRFRSCALGSAPCRCSACTYTAMAGIVRQSQATPPRRVEKWLFASTLTACSSCNSA
eukprot:1836767-Pyramimonas_sp.AAC.1